MLLRIQGLLHISYFGGVVLCYCVCVCPCMLPLDCHWVVTNLMPLKLANQRDAFKGSQRAKRASLVVCCTQAVVNTKKYSDREDSVDWLWPDCHSPFLEEEK